MVVGLNEMYMENFRMILRRESEWPPVAVKFGNQDTFGRQRRAVVQVLFLMCAEGHDPGPGPAICCRLRPFAYGQVVPRGWLPGKIDPERMVVVTGN
jgi:hypothetical protein